MKNKLLIAAAALLLLALPAFAQLRLDIGLDVPYGFSTSTMGATDLGSSLGGWRFIPVPDIGFHYNFNFGVLDLGAGLRAFTFILETVLWPNVYGEVNLGPVVFEAQVGGGLFAAFGLANSATLGAAVIPDLSAWIKLGRNRSFRLGGGALAMYAPATLGNTIPILVYLGGKVSLEL